MYYSTTMSANFETEKNRKALAYTAAICGMLLLIAFLISWKLPEPRTPLVQDLIEINLGNEIEGFGKVQPLIRGDKAPADAVARQIQNVAASENTAKDIPTDNNPDKDAAPINKPVKTPVKINTPVPVITPEPRPQRPKIAGYNGPKNGKGNGAVEDNNFRMQGNNPGSKGDNGNPNGKPDSYGNNPGGKSGGSPRVMGDRHIIRYYSFTGELEKATIFAFVKVSPDGTGRFSGFAKNSTSTNSSYSNSIVEYLRNIKFDPADHESTVTVQFNFNVN